MTEATMSGAPVSGEGFLCQVCNLDYGTWTQFEEHFWSMIHHKQLEVRYGSGKTHVCCLCRSRSDSLSDYAKHLISLTHRDAVDKRKKQKQLEVAANSSRQSKKNEPQPTEAPGSRHQGNHNPTGSCNELVPNHPHSWSRWPVQSPQKFSRFSLWGDNYVDDSNIHQSFKLSSARQWNCGNGRNNIYCGNRTWTPMSSHQFSHDSVNYLSSRPNNSENTVSRITQRGPELPGKHLAEQKSAARSKLVIKLKSQNVSSKNKTELEAKSNPNTSMSREQPSAKPSLNHNSKPVAKTASSGSRQSHAASCHGDGQPASSKPADAGTETMALCSKPDQLAPSDQTTTKISVESKSATAFSAKREWDISASCHPQRDKPGQDKASDKGDNSSAEDQDECLKGAAAYSIIKKKETSKNPITLQRSDSLPSTSTVLKSPPEVTRLKLPRTDSDPFGKESISNLSSSGPAAVSEQPASYPTESFDEEASVTRIQLPPSLQRELTKLLAKSQGSTPRPNLATARSRLHAGEHHQAKVVDSPDRMVQQLLMKLLDSPKSQHRKLQQVEELQRLVQASKKGSERARFASQQPQEVHLSLQFLESLLQTGQLKPLLSEDASTSSTSARHEQLLPDNKKTQNGSITGTLDQKPSMPSTTDPECSDSKAAVQALIQSTSSQQVHVTRHDDVHVASNKASKSLKTTSGISARSSTQSPLHRQEEGASAEAVKNQMMLEYRGKASTKGKSNSSERSTIPFQDVTLRTEPNSGSNKVSAETPNNWALGFEFVDSKEAALASIQSTVSKEKENPLTTSSTLVHENVNFNEVTQSDMFASNTLAALPACPSLLKPPSEAAVVQGKATVEHSGSAKTQGKPSGPEYSSAPIMDVTIKTEPNTDSIDGTTHDWTQGLELVDSKEAILASIQSTVSSKENQFTTSSTLARENDNFAGTVQSHVSASNTIATPPEAEDIATPPEAEDMRDKTQAKPNGPEFSSSLIVDVTIKTEPNTDTNEISKGAPHEMIPISIATVTDQHNASWVQSVEQSESGAVNSEEMLNSAAATNPSLPVQGLSTLNASTEAGEPVSTDAGQGGTISIIAVPDLQLGMPVAVLSGSEMTPLCPQTAPTRKGPAQGKLPLKSPLKRTPAGGKDLQEALLELSLQEELLHKELGTVDKRMKTIKELIRQKQLLFKKLKDQKNKISADALGIRTRRLQLLWEAAPGPSLPAPHSLAVHPACIEQDPCRNSLASTSTAFLSLENAAHSSSRGGAAPSLSVVEPFPISKPPGLAVSGEPSREPSSLSGSVSQSGLEKHSNGPVNHRPGIGKSWTQAKVAKNAAGEGRKKAANSRKRKLTTQDADALITTKAKIAKVSNRQNLGKTDSVGLSPATWAEATTDDSTRENHVTPSNASPLNPPQDTNSVSTGLSLALLEETSPHRRWATEVKPHKIDSLLSSKTTKDQKAQKFADREASLKPPKATCPFIIPESRLGRGTLRAKTQSTTKHVDFEVFEISSDSDDFEALNTSLTKMRQANPSHSPVTVVQGPKPTNARPTQARTWPPCGVFPNHDGAVLGMLLCVSKQRLYTAGADHTARVYGIDDFRCKKVFSDHTKEVTCLAMWTAKYLCTGSSDRSIRVYNTETMNRETSFFCESRVTCLAVQGEWLFAGLANGTVDVIDLPRWRMEKNLTCKPECKIEAMVPTRLVPHLWCRVNRGLLIGYEDWTIGVHSATNGKLLRSLHGHNGVVLCMVMLKHLLYSGSADKTVMVHDLRSSQHVQTIRLDSPVTGLHRCGGSIITVCAEGKIHVHVSDPEKVDAGRMIASFPQKICCMALHRKTVYIGCSDGTVQAIPTQPSEKSKKKKKSTQARVKCQWISCTTQKSSHSKMFNHLRDFHVRQSLSKQCCWGTCGVVFANLKKRQIDEHIIGHVEDLYSDFERAEVQKLKGQLNSHRQRKCKKRNQVSHVNIAGQS
ncbi:uncharacterized protein LOC110979253 isoform X1 [Acanthaster planci]|uniref:Uncharacterized protein LOC110979253 isoform X1 n=1 Tax=Acanthaster planci TaxID=133434 RepID=A0A8B7YDC7_ACAPL|nr:uncharacterized protein LOC110979253 isoform X1 [Acanthaster planci]